MNKNLLTSKTMRGILISILSLFLFSGCATFDPNIPIENRLAGTMQTLEAIEAVVPELVLSGDITDTDALKMAHAINKAQAAIRIAQAGLLEGLPTDPLDQIDMAITALRVAQHDIESEKARQSIGRTIAALVIAKAMMLPTSPH